MNRELETYYDGGIGDNSANRMLTVEVRLFNSLACYGGDGGCHRTMELPVGTTIREIAAMLGIPFHRLFLVLVNGRDITPGLVGDAVQGAYQIENGDVIALSGPVPYSYGYGAPVV